MKFSQYITTAEKLKRISDSLVELAKKRKTQDCCVYEVKIDKSFLDQKHIDNIEQLFLEAKWLYNYLVGLAKLEGSKAVYKLSMSRVNTISVLNTKTGYYETKELKNLRSSQRVEIQRYVQSLINDLHMRKFKDVAGALRFKSDINNIPLRQYRVTHRIIDHNKIKIQGLNTRDASNYFKVRGLKKLYNNPDIDITTANLIKRPSGYYIRITTYKDKAPVKERNGESIAIHFGSNDTITLSDGRVFDFSCSDIKKRIKKLNNKLSRQVKGSSNSKKTLAKIELFNEKLVNKRNDYANKFIAMIRQYSRVVILDETTDNKKPIFKLSTSDKIRAKLELMKNDNVVVLDKVVPIDQWCQQCGTKINTVIGDEFHCPKCSLTEPNSLHTAKNMKFILDNFIPVGRREFNYVEFGNYLRVRASNWEA